MKRIILFIFCLCFGWDAFAATPPVFVTSTQTVFTTSTTPRGTANVSVQSGDCMVVVGATADSGATLAVTDGMGSTWTTQQTVTTANYTFVGAWTAIAATTSSNSFTLTKTGSNVNSGIVALIFRGCSIGTSNKNNAATSTPTVTLIGVAANSAIVAINGDWNAADMGACAGINSGFCLWTAINGGPTNPQLLAAKNSTNYSYYVDYYADTGGAGNQSPGLTGPASQKWAMIGVEVVGTGGGGGSTVHSLGALGVGN